MAEWLMSIVGIVAAGVLLEIILPPGDTSKYAKGAYALIVVLVLASPMSNVLSQFKSDKSAAVDIDTSFLSAVGDRLEESDELRAERALADAGFDECEVNIFASASGAYSAERANVDVSNCPQKGEIDERYLIEIVKKCLGCKEVKIYGQRE